MKNNDIIRLEKSDDHREVENLTREAFWNVYRPGCTEHCDPKSVQTTAE